MPAPAVIPAPRAYINAVAVKGFVVELRAVKGSDQVPLAEIEWGPSLLQSVNTIQRKQILTGTTIISSQS